MNMLNHQQFENCNFLPCLSGTEIFKLSQFNSYIAELKNLVSCPNNIYCELYLTTLYRLAEFCESMPFREDDFNSPYGFLTRQLNLAITTLKLRRGVLFPKNAGTEQISAEEAQWTYAVFSCALLKDLHYLHSNQIIATSLINGENASLWSPQNGTLYKKGYYYHWNFDKKTKPIRVDTTMTILSKWIVPSIVPHWFTQNDTLFNQWHDVIIHKPTKENEIEKLIKLAAEKCKITLQDTREENFKQEFINYLEKGIEQNPDRIFKMNTGLFVSNELIEDFLSERKFLSKNSFIQLLEKAYWLVFDNNNCHHLVTPTKFEDRRVLNGIIINIDVLPEKLQRLPLNTYFQKQIKL